MNKCVQAAGGRGNPFFAQIAKMSPAAFKSPLVAQSILGIKGLLTKKFQDMKFLNFREMNIFLLDIESQNDNNCS